MNFFGNTKKVTTWMVVAIVAAFCGLRKKETK